MRMKTYLLLTCCIVIGTILSVESQGLKFPKGFVFGASTASYQVEGAYRQDGRGWTIWDTFSHTPGKVYNNENGDVADDHYNRLEQDVAIMKALGIKFYRMSIAWSRILPNGRPPINYLGVAHYNREIDLLLAANITPFITLFHWDLPQALEDEYQGWLTSNTSDAFAVYAETCFALFGDRVKHWLTLNEPHTVAINGYLAGSHAPGRCSDRSICPQGNGTTEPYIAAYHMLLAHAKAVDVYRRRFQPFQNGTIGIALDCAWGEPKNESNPSDVEASSRYMEYFIGWFADPIFKGDYPESMKQYVGDRLPPFTEAQKILLLGSADFFALNHYTSTYTQYLDSTNSSTLIGWYKDMHVLLTNEKDGVLIGPQAASSWLYVVPYGIRKLLVWLSQRYGIETEFYITENGVDVPGENDMPLKEALNDTFRVNFYNDYLTQLSLAIYQHGVNVKGYMAWSLLDNFEWNDGYSKRFGLHYVDYTDQSRYQKASAMFYHNLITTCCQDD